MCNTSAVFQPKMLVVSRILAIFLLIAIIQLSRISAEISFQPSGIFFKNRLGSTPKVLFWEHNLTPISTVERSTEQKKRKTEKQHKPPDICYSLYQQHYTFL